jgi:hypothetical protein
MPRGGTIGGSVANICRQLYRYKKLDTKRRRNGCSRAGALIGRRLMEPRRNDGRARHLGRSCDNSQMGRPLFARIARLWCKLRGRVIFADSKTQRKQTGMLGIDEFFKGRHFDREIIILCVRWYLRFKLSFRDFVEMMTERGIDLAHTTIMRGVQRYAPEFERRWNRFAVKAGGIAIFAKNRRFFSQFGSATSSLKH